MSLLAPLVRDLGALGSVEVRPVGLDDLSAVRYVHTTSFRSLASARLGENEVAAFCEHVNSPVYSEIVLSEELIAAWTGSQMVGTAGWIPGEGGTNARIRSVFVHPLFTRCGIGRLLVERVEHSALLRGFRAFSVRATLNSVPFFEAIGYQVTSYGLRSLGGSNGLPVAFLRKASEVPKAMVCTAQAV